MMCELTIEGEEDIDFLVDSISIAWQFYSSFLHTKERVTSKIKY